MSEEQPKKEKRERKEKKAKSKDGVEKKVKKDRKEKKSRSKDKEQKLAKTAFSLLADEQTLNPALSSLFNAQVGREALSSI